MKKVSPLKGRQVSFYALIILYLLIMPFFSSKAITKEEGIALAFQGTHAELEGFNINAYTSIQDQFIGEKDALGICLEIAERLGLEDRKIERNILDQDIHVWINETDKEGNHRTIMVQAWESDGMKETNIMIDVEGSDPSVSLHEEVQKIKDVLNIYGKPEVTSWIAGTYQGKLEEQDKNKIIERIMKELKVKEIEALREENMMSVVGYSDQIMDWISYGGNKVNLNIALRYNSYEDKTFIWIGSPLITIGY